MIRIFKYLKIISFFAGIGCVLFCLSPAKALDFTPPPFNDLNYRGAYDSQSIADPVSIKTGETREIVVRFKNIGSTTWYPTGANYVSVYTVDPNYRASVFNNSSWLGKSQPAKISATTKPGQVAEIKIKLTRNDIVRQYMTKQNIFIKSQT